MQDSMTKSNRNKKNKATVTKTVVLTTGSNRGPKKRSTTRVKVSPQQRVSQKVSTRSRWSACARDYFRSLEDPFAMKVSCIPTTLNTPSQKFCSWSRGTFTTGTAGTGWIIVSPGRGMSSDLNCAYYTMATYTGTSALRPFAGDLGVSSSNTNAPYASTNVQEDYSVRLVASGLRVRNITPLLSRGAITYMLEQQAHQTLISAVSNTDPNVDPLNDWGSMEGVESLNLDSGDWGSVVFHPMNPTEMAFDGANNWAASSTVNFSRGNWTLGAQVNQTSAMQTFEFEIVTIYEAVGRLIVGESPSHSDTVGMDTISNILSSIQIRKPRVGDRFAGLKRILSSSSTIAQEIGTYASAASQLLALI